MDYTINFSESVDPAAIRTALVEEFEVPAELIYVGDQDDLLDHVGPDPVVVVYSPDPGLGYSCELGAGDDFAEMIDGISELELAKRLCHLVGATARIDAGDDDPDVWTLVDSDGNHGPVVVDDQAADEGDLRVIHAREPIPGHPEMTVVPAPS